MSIIFNFNMLLMGLEPLIINNILDIKILNFNLYKFYGYDLFEQKDPTPYNWSSQFTNQPTKL